MKKFLNSLLRSTATCSETVNGKSYLLVCVCVHPVVQEHGKLSLLPCQLRRTKDVFQLSNELCVLDLILPGLSSSDSKS